MHTLKAFFLGAALLLGIATQSGAQAQLPNFADLVERYGPAVVNINTQARAQRQQFPGLDEDDPFYDFFRRFAPPGQAPRGRGDRNDKGSPPAQRGPLQPFGLGSGFIVSADGYIVTNAHVVDKAEEITIRLTDKRELKAKVIGVDARSDVAVLKVDATGLPYVKIGDSSTMRVGEWVIAIGSPFGFSNTVTAGILSAKSRDMPADRNTDAVPFLQTDVAVNPGNSGGPLFNMRGEVIGINSQIFSRTGSFAGISFAIPIEYAINVADQLRKTGHVTRGRIGVEISSVTRELAESLGLPKAEGAVIGRVEDDSPASKAGMESGDVVLRIDGKAVEGSPDLSRIIRAMRPGTKVNLTIWRAGKTRDIALVIGELKEDAPVKAAKAGAKAEAKTGKLGLAVSELTGEQKRTLKVSGGVMVEAVDGAAAAAGISAGDIILRINNTDVTNVKSFNETLAKTDSTKSVALLVRDENGTRFVPVRPDE